MKLLTKKITLATAHPIQIIDITDRVRSIVEESGIKNGFLNIMTQHTTTAININEKEEGLQRDMIDFLERIVPRDADYIHNRNAIDGRANAHSHLLGLFTNTSETIPVVDGKPALGGWQSVFFIELNGPRDERTVVVQIGG